MDKASPWFYRISGLSGAVLGASVCLLLTACVATPPPRPSVPLAAAPGSARFPDGAASRVRSKDLDFPIELRLPNKSEWALADGPSWLVARHPATSSELALRTWRAERLVRRAECVAQARLARASIPEIKEEAVVDRRALDSPRDFDTELVVGVEPTERGISGYAIAIGASVGRCYAAVFTTTVAGNGAEQEVAARLGVVVDRILASVRLRSVDDRAVRRRLVVSPAGTPARPAAAGE